MKNIIAFAGSNSKTSINKQLVTYVVGLMDGVEVKILDLNDFNLPIYSIDFENEKGIPEAAHKFLKHIHESDGIVLSLAEHNGAYTTAFKNILDWMSRIEGSVFDNKPMLLMATSPGARGGQSVLTIAQDRFPRHEADIVAVFSLPRFNDNFKDGKITSNELNKQLLLEVEKFKSSIAS